MDDEQYSKLIVDTLNAQQSVQVTTNDFDAWFDGETDGDVELFETAILNVMRRDQRDVAENLARLPNYLEWRLGIGERFCGGIDFINIDEM